VSINAIPPMPHHGHHAKPNPLENSTTNESDFLEKLFVMSSSSID